MPSWGVLYCGHDKKDHKNIRCAFSYTLNGGDRKVDVNNYTTGQIFD